MQFFKKGEEDYDRLRPLSYADTDLFVITFSIANPKSFDNVQKKWRKEVAYYMPDVPVLLVGTFSDCRDRDANLAQSLIDNWMQGFITVKQGKAMAQKLGCVSYMEVSAVYTTKPRDFMLALFKAHAFANDPSINAKFASSHLEFIQKLTVESTVKYIEEALGKPHHEFSTKSIGVLAEVVENYCNKLLPNSFAAEYDRGTVYLQCIKDYRKALEAYKCADKAYEVMVVKQSQQQQQEQGKKEELPNEKQLFKLYSNMCELLARDEYMTAAYAPETYTYTTKLIAVHDKKMEPLKEKLHKHLAHKRYMQASDILTSIANQEENLIEWLSAAAHAALQMESKGAFNREEAAFVYAQRLLNNSTTLREDMAAFALEYALENNNYNVLIDSVLSDFERLRTCISDGSIAPRVTVATCLTLVLALQQGQGIESQSQEYQAVKEFLSNFTAHPNTPVDVEKQIKDYILSVLYAHDAVPACFLLMVTAVLDLYLNKAEDAKQRIVNAEMEIVKMTQDDLDSADERALARDHFVPSFKLFVKLLDFNKPLQGMIFKATKSETQLPANVESLRGKLLVYCDKAAQI